MRTRASRGPATFRYAAPFAALAFAVLAGCAPGPRPSACTPGASAMCFCGSSMGSQVCNATGSGFAPCSCEIPMRDGGTSDAPGPSCTRDVGESCTTQGDCCPGATGIPSRCVTLDGFGTVCTAECSVGTDCRSGCCVGTTASYNVCSLPESCPSPSCTSSVYTTCTADAQCCADTEGGGTNCTDSGYCNPLCITDADCTTGWTCVAQSDGVRTCVP